MLRPRRSFWSIRRPPGLRCSGSKQPAQALPASEMEKIGTVWYSKWKRMVEKIIVVKLSVGDDPLPGVLSVRRRRDFERRRLQGERDLREKRGGRGRLRLSGTHVQASAKGGAAGTRERKGRAAAVRKKGG